MGLLGRWLQRSQIKEYFLRFLKLRDIANYKLIYLMKQTVFALLDLDF
jgi:hypothetical protein